MKAEHYFKRTGPRLLAMTVSLAIASLMGGCASSSTTEQGAGYGAAGGAVLGGALGGWEGAAIGAGAGALGGAAVGAAKENADAKREARTGSSGIREYYDPDRDEYYYYNEDGDRIYVGRSRTTDEDGYYDGKANRYYHYDSSRDQYYYYNRQGNRVYTD